MKLPPQIIVLHMARSPTPDARTGDGAVNRVIAGCDIVVAQQGLHPG